MFFYQAQRQPKTQTGPNILLGGIERFEDSFTIFGRDASSIVQESDAHALPDKTISSAGFRSANDKRTTLRKCLDCIGGQIGKNLPNFARESEDHDVVAVFRSKHNFLKAKLS